MAQLFANNAYGVLAGTVNGAATLLVLVSGQGARFPAPTGGDYFLATLVGLDGNGAESVWEIVKCTGRSTDQLTVVRAQEGTTATTWNAGTRIEMRWTKEGINGKETVGVAAAAVVTHAGLADPHPQYAPKANPTFSGTVSGVTKTHVGLGNVDNTSDANKPISTAAQNALDAKLSDAPSNGKAYARKDTAWAEVTGGVGGDATNNIGYLNIPQNSQSAAYTCVLADAGKHILHPDADTTARTFTIPANASVPYPIGTAITFVNQNGTGGVVTIAITTDTMRLAGAGTTGSRTLARNGVATAMKITATEWIISGSGLS